jgi:molybdate transport system permease protein
MRGRGRLGTLLLLIAAVAPATAGERLLIATASNFKPAMEALLVQFRARHPDAQVEAVYASTGKLDAQIRAGAPFDVFCAADMDSPARLVADRFADAPVREYARGRLALWSATTDAGLLTLEDLVDPRFARIAIANPRHAPYGMRAREALQASGVWATLESRLVIGENIGQTAQFVQTGNADIGLVALSQVLDPQPAEAGDFSREYGLVPEALHTPLAQGMVITSHGTGNPLATAFADLLHSDAARPILERYGYAATMSQAPAIDAERPLLSDADWIALGLSLKLATTATLLLLVFATPLAWWLARTRSWWGRPVSALVALPLVLPPTVLGFYLLVALGPQGPLGQLTESLGIGLLPFTFPGLVIASLLYSLPFVVQPLRAAFEGIGEATLEEAATLGAGPLDRFFTIALPMARRGIAAGGILGFIHTIGEFGVVLMIGGSIPGATRVVSVQIYDHVEAFDYAQAHGLAGLLLALSFGALLLLYSFNPRLRSV